MFGQKIYSEISQVPAEIDLAVILTPAPTVPDILDQCGRKGIRFAVIESGGFREFAQDRTQLEGEILEVARKYDLRFIGPNGIGNINMENGLCLPFMHLNRGMRLGLFQSWLRAAG